MVCQHLLAGARRERMSFEPKEKERRHVHPSFRPPIHTHTLQIPLIPELFKVTTNHVFSDCPSKCPFCTTRYRRLGWVALCRTPPLISSSDCLRGCLKPGIDALALHMIRAICSDFILALLCSRESRRCHSKAEEIWFLWHSYLVRVWDKTYSHGSFRVWRKSGLCDLMCCSINALRQLLICSRLLSASQSIGIIYIGISTVKNSRESFFRRFWFRITSVFDFRSLLALISPQLDCPALGLRTATTSSDLGRAVLDNVSDIQGKFSERRRTWLCLAGRLCRGLFIT